MKRSEINRLIRNAESFFAEHRVRLPPWAARTPDQWKPFSPDESEIRDNMLGWDITDFGSGEYPRRGLLLFTLRNGNQNRDRKPYAEKLMAVLEGQETPLHFHRSKMEDIIVRGGGNLVVEIFPSQPDGALGLGSVTLRTDGVTRVVPAGGRIVLGPGESVCLEQGVYHRFWGESGRGTVLVGEVSMVNDDNSDNRFFETIGRFPAVEEDESPHRLLVSDYQQYLRG